MKGFRCWFSVSRQNKGGKPNSRPSLLSTTSFPNQVSYNNVSVAIVHLVVVSENVQTIAVTENMVIDEEDSERIWIGYSLDRGETAVWTFWSVQPTPVRIYNEIKFIPHKVSV